jgi:Cupin
MLCLTVHRTNVGGMDILAQVLDRVRLGGTLLFHFELGHPWNLELPARPYTLFHYLSRGSATLALEQGRDLHLTEGDFVVVTRGEPHLIYSDRRTKSLPIVDLDRLPAGLTTDRSALCRGAPKLDRVSQSRTRRMAWGDIGPTYRTGA